ncbi:hypothetical protein EOL70_11345 [Leucothrix sargassi]|nr:hypothetical protein EOL70_11345 [Leucothrix sargassi]
MEFKLSQDYIRKKIRGPFVNLFAMLVLPFAFALGTFVFEGIRHGIVVLIGIGFLFILSSIEAVKKSKLWRRLGSSISVSVEEGYILYKGQDGESKLYVEAIDSVRIKKKKGKVRLIIIKSNTGMKGHCQGFENMELLSEKIVSLVSEDKVRVSRSFF